MRNADGQTRRGILQTTAIGALACGVTVATSAACIKTQRESKAYRYCWPHDIARRGACTIP